MEIHPTKTGAIIHLKPADVESAIRQFIVACHPELGAGHVVDPVIGQNVWLPYIKFEAIHVHPCSSVVKSS